MTITVRNTLLTAAKLLGVDEEVALYLSGEDTEAGEQATKLLLTAYRNVENELALDYLPLTAEDEVITATGVIEYERLAHSAVRVFSVEDEWGKPLKYELFPDRLQTAAGRVRVFYAYAPRAKELADDSEYQTAASERLLAYGVAAEYSLAMGELTAASAWDKKYKEGVQAAYRLHPCKKIRSRRWA